MPEQTKWIGFADIRKLEELKKQKRENESHKLSVVPNVEVEDTAAEQSEPTTIDLNSTAAPAAIAAIAHVSPAIAENSIEQTPSILESTAIACPTIEEPTKATHTLAQEEHLLSQSANVDSGAIAEAAIAPDQFTAVPNGILDRVIPTLVPFDQSVLLRLYRLSRGFHKETCTVGYATLARACNMSSRQAQVSVERLIARGLLERVGVEQGGKSRQERGSIYKVLLPAASTRAARAIAQDTIAPDAHNKNKYKKETSKEGTSVEISKCPDCHGTGWWYPQGYEKGTAKCKHSKLRA